MPWLAVLADLWVVNINQKENIMPNYNTYNTDPYARFLDWRNRQQGGYLNSQSRLTPDTTGQGDWQTGSNVLTPQNAVGQGMTQVGEGKYVSNSLAKYYDNGQGGTQQVSPLNAGANNNLPMTQNSEMMGPQRPGFFQNQWNKARNSYRDSPFNKAIHPDSPWAGRAQPVASGTNAVGGTASTVQGGGMGGAMGYLGAANAIMGMMNRNQGSSQPVVSQPVVVNNPPPMGGSYSRGERRNRLSSLPNYASGFGNVPNKNALLYKPRYAGYETRDITPSEDTFFQKNPHVAGMATEDKRIITNPHSGLPPQQNELVRMLEASRLYMNDNNINPDFELTPNQVDFFNDPSMKVVGGVQYRDNPNAAKQSIISRIIVGDPSAQDVTPEQQSYADMISEKMGIKPRMGTKPQYAANFIGSPDVDEFGNPIRSGNALVRIMNRETPNNQSVFNTPTQASPTSMESPTTASIEKPGLFTRIGNAFRPKEQPIPADYNTPEGANYLNRLMAESQRKPTFTEKLPQALALMSGAFDPYGRFANANANIINMTQQQEQARRQAPVNYLNQVMARSQVENIPLQQKMLQSQAEKLAAEPEYIKAQTKALGEKTPELTPTRLAVMAATEKARRGEISQEDIPNEALRLSRNTAATNKTLAEQVEEFNALGEVGQETYGRLKGGEGQNATLAMAKQIAKQEVASGKIKPEEEKNRAFELYKSTPVWGQEGLSFVSPTGGTTPTGIRKVLPAGEVDEISKFNSVLNSVDKLEALYDPSFVGMYEGRRGGLLGAAGWNKPKEDAFRASIGELMKTYMDVAGKNFTQMEQKILEPYMPSSTDSDSQFKEKLANFRVNYKDIVGNKIKAFEQAGYGAKGLETPAARIPSRTEVPTRDEFVNKAIKDNPTYTPAEAGAYYDSKYGVK